MMPPGLETTAPLVVSSGAVMATVSGAATALSMGQGARTGPLRSMAAVFLRVLPATEPKLPAMKADASLTEIPRTSDV